MGITYSISNIMSSAIYTDVTITTTRADGTQIIERTKKNPWVSGIVVISGTIIILVCIDGGNGTITNSFGKVCINCSKKSDYKP